MQTTAVGQILIFADIPFTGLRLEDLLRPEQGLKRISTINAEGIVWYHEHDLFREAVRTSMACIDGQIPYWLARWRSSEMSFEKLSGSDLIYHFAALARDQGLRMFLLGADSKANRLSCLRLRSQYGIPIEGYAPPFHPYPFPHRIDEEILSRVRAFRPDILLVAFGMPKQEVWLYTHHDELEEMGVRWAIGVGGTLDFVSGRERRAPQWVQQMGLEFLWRLLQRPARWRRVWRALRLFRYL